MFEGKDIGHILHVADMTAKNRLTNQLDGYGITPGQYAVLKEIYYHSEDGNNGLSPACIADRIHCDRPTISGIIERLEAQGWIVRLRNSEDKRSVIIQVTDKTIAHMPEFDEIFQDNRSIILNGFTKEEEDAFKNFLLRVIHNFKNIEDGMVTEK